MNKRSTPEQIADAREWFDEEELAQLSAEYGSISTKHIRVLLAATEPPTDEEIAEHVAEHHRQHLPCNPFAGRPEHQMKILRTGDQTFTIAAVVAVMRHFFGPVKP